MLLTLGLTLSAPFVVELITGSAANLATDVLRIQSLAMIASFVASATGYALLSLRRHRATLIANLGSLVVVVVAALALTPGMGAQGGAIAAVLADFMLAVGGTMLLVRRRPAAELRDRARGAGRRRTGDLAGTLVGDRS